LLQVMMTGAAIVILPTVWLRDLSLMSILSLGGFAASAALLLLLMAQGVAFPLPAAPLPVPLFSLSHLPISIGLYSFCFAGEAASCDMALLT
jgi:solute carrier family 32 (vesicular inhibitory amino acid transporter)